MKLSHVIEGLQILQRYHSQDGHEVGAEHDVLYVYPGDKTISESDVARLRELGWRQEGVKDRAVYEPEMSWAAYV